MQIMQLILKDIKWLTSNCNKVSILFLSSSGVVIWAKVSSCLHYWNNCSILQYLMPHIILQFLVYNGRDAFPVFTNRQKLTLAAITTSTKN